MAQEVYDLISKISAGHVTDPTSLVVGQYYILINKSRNGLPDGEEGPDTAATIDKLKGNYPLSGMSIGRFAGKNHAGRGGYFFSSGPEEQVFDYDENAIFSLNADKVFIAKDGGKRTSKRKSKSHKSKHRKTRRA